MYGHTEQNVKQGQVIRERVKTITQGWLQFHVDVTEIQLLVQRQEYSI
jgi:hypothetical protein